MTHGTRGEVALPHFEDALWERLERLHHERTSAVRRRRGRGAYLAVAAAVAVAAGLVVVSTRDTESVVSSGGWGSPGTSSTVTAGTTPGTAPGPGPVPAVSTPPAPATPESGKALAARIAAAMDTGRGRTLMHSIKPNVEEWYDPVTAAWRHRRTTPEGRTLKDAGWPVPPGVDEAGDAALVPPITGAGQCDNLTRLMMNADGQLVSCNPPGPALPQARHVERTVDHCSRTYTDLQAPLVQVPGLDFVHLFLDAGTFVVDGTQELEGRPMIRVRNGSGSFVVLIDPDRALPVQTSESSTGTPFVITYDYLPRTPETLALLSPPVPPGFVPAGAGPASGPGPGC